MALSVSWMTVSTDPLGTGSELDHPRETQSSLNRTQGTFRSSHQDAWAFPGSGEVTPRAHEKPARALYVPCASHWAQCPCDTREEGTHSNRPGRGGLTKGTESHLLLISTARSPEVYPVSE